MWTYDICAFDTGKYDDELLAINVLRYTLASPPEKTTRSSPHHVAQHHPTRSKTTTPHSPRSSRFGSELPSVEDDVDVWRYAILELHARNDDDDDVTCHKEVMQA